MDDEAFRANFPGSDASDLLLELFRRQQSLTVQPPVELSDERGSAEAWFSGDIETAAQFVPFGYSPDGGLVAFWRYDERPIKEAPIVYLDSEGDTCGVVARNVEEFASLVATGEELYYLLRGQRDPHPADMSELGIAAAADPVAIVRAAQAEHPDLDAFIRERLEGWFVDGLDEHNRPIRRIDTR